MIVAVEIGFSFKRALPGADLTLELSPAADVLAALRALAARHPEIRDRLLDAEGQPHRHINALINGGNVSYRQGFRTPLQDGDRLTILPPVGGG
jgi:molybdopterin converting factor small subunit